jgi:hypothetical protein
MPHYYFHIASPNEFTSDEIGVECRDVEAAYLDAFQGALEISIEMLRQRQNPFVYRFEICNKDGELLLDLPFSEILAPAARPAPTSQLYQSLQRHHQRAQKAQGDLKLECEQVRSLLRSTRALLASLPS